MPRARVERARRDLRRREVVVLERARARAEERVRLHERLWGEADEGERDRAEVDSDQSLSARIRRSGSMRRRI